MTQSGEFLRLKRVYEPPSSTDGMRVLVDRLWPRGLTKADAAIHVWLKEVSPSTELRKSFGHDMERFAEFRIAYEWELGSDASHVQAVAQIMEWCQHQPVTLLYAAKDTVCNHGVVLRDLLVSRS